MKHLIPAILLFTASASQAIAEDRLDMKGTSVIGNQELPKVLYVVPWKNSELPDMEQPALQSLIDEILQPLDREEFQREVNFYHSLHDPK